MTKTARIIETFEEFLNEKNIKIKNFEKGEAKKDNPEEIISNIFGSDYYKLENKLNFLNEDNLYENYEPYEILKAFLIHESEFRLKELFNKDEDFINKNKENLADILFDMENLFNYDAIDNQIEEFLDKK